MRFRTVRRTTHRNNYNLGRCRGAARRSSGEGADGNPSRRRSPRGARREAALRRPPRAMWALSSPVLFTFDCVVAEVGGGLKVINALFSSAASLNDLHRRSVLSCEHSAAEHPSSRSDARCPSERAFIVEAFAVQINQKAFPLFFLTSFQKLLQGKLSWITLCSSGELSLASVLSYVH